MKYKFFGIMLIIFLSLSCSGKKDPEKTITISGAFALYPLAVQWAEEFKEINPDVNIDISAGGAGKGMTDVLSGMVDIGMVSREIAVQEIEKGAWVISVAIDAVVPAMNSANPLYEVIKKRGLTSKDFSILWKKGEIKKWSNIITGLKEDFPVNVYTRSDACGAAQTWGAFMKMTQEDLDGIAVYGDPGLAEAVRKDVYGIGYNNINFIYDRNSRKPVPGLAIIPIDINGNGKIDRNEDIYDTRESLISAIAKGNFPSPPSRKLYFVMKGFPEKEVLKQFLHYVLTEGQSHVNDAGYILLQSTEVKKNLERLGK